MQPTTNFKEILNKASRLVLGLSIEKQVQAEHKRQFKFTRIQNTEDLIYDANGQEYKVIVAAFHCFSQNESKSNREIHKVTITNLTVKELHIPPFVYMWMHLDLTCNTISCVILILQGTKFGQAPYFMRWTSQHLCWGCNRPFSMQKPCRSCRKLKLCCCRLFRVLSGFADLGWAFTFILER